ncbi:MAG: hypothetical protein IT381_19375 [Deltaproteobacteria bacterium]|nr:hypothetical protein [Deltaproteobacteria bacterium]
MAGQTKGANLINTIAVARDRLGEQRFAELLERLPERTRELVKRRIVAVEWVALDDWMPFLQTLFAEHCRSDEVQWREWAHAFCERDFNTVYKFFLKLGSPGFIIGRAARVWRTYNDSGQLEVLSREQREKETHILMRLSDFEPYPLYAVSVQGFMEQLLAMSGAKASTVRMTARDVKNGRLVAEYAITYS